MLQRFARFTGFITGGFGKNGRSRFWQRLHWIAALVVFSFSFNAACCLEVATITSLEIHRYMTVQMYSALLAQLLGFWFILEFVVCGSTEDKMRLSEREAMNHRSFGR